MNSFAIYANACEKKRPYLITLSFFVIHNEKFSFAVTAVSMRTMQIASKLILVLSQKFGTVLVASQRSHQVRNMPHLLTMKPMQAGNISVTQQLPAASHQRKLQRKSQVVRRIEQII